MRCIGKTVLKQVLVDNQHEVERYGVFRRDVDMESFPCYAFVGVRRAGKSYLLYQKMLQLLASYTRLAKILSAIGGKISVPTVASYIQYCEDSWLLLRMHNVASAFADKETKSKYYFVDNGLLNLFLIDSDTTLLENAVAVELFRKYGHDMDNERVFFYNSNIEVDFYVPDEELAVQVSYRIGDSSSDTYKREVGALQKLPSALSCSKRLIITYDEERTIEDANGVIEVVPYWKWALGQT